MDPKFISIIVPAHNEQEYIAKCLKSLISQDYPKEKYEIIVVDNNSVDNTKKIAQRFGVRVIAQETGRVGAVRNAGAKQAKGEVLAFIDADCVAPSNWITTGVNLLNRQAAVYGGGCDLQQEPFWIERAWLLKNKLPPRELLGCNIFIQKSDFIEVGLFDEKITSGEDTKLSTSLRNRDYHVIMLEELNVVHLGNPITLKSFFLRQVWHSENYFQNWVETKRDPTFYFLMIFLSGFILLLPSLFFENLEGLLISLLAITGTPLIFTTKRLHRSRDPRENLRNLPSIYFLDFVYLTGRIFGLFKSSRQALTQFTSHQTQQAD